MKPRIPLDFSAISTLHCARRYQWTCVTGYDTSNDYSKFGSAVHIFLEDLAKGKLPADIRDNPASQLDYVQQLANKFTLSAPLLNKLLSTITQWLHAADTKIPTPVTTSEGKLAVEFKFAFDILETANFIFSLCGTTDLVTRTDNLLILEDYKTCAQCKDFATVEAGYMATMQLPLYMYAIRKLAPTLFPDLAHLSIMGRYRMIYYNLPAIKVRYTSYVEPWPDEEIEGVLLNAVERMERAWLKDGTCLPEGRAIGGCAKLKCPFIDACLTQNDNFRSTILGQFPIREYNPLNFR